MSNMSPHPSITQLRLVAFNGPEVVLKTDSWGLKVNLDIHWVKDMVQAHWEEQTSINYGNKNFSDTAYHKVCLVVKVGKPGSRRDPEPTFYDESKSNDEDME